MNKTFLDKVINFTKKDIIKVFSFTAISTLVKMLTGLISIKVVAVIVGPTGVALLGQLNNFSKIIMTSASGGINSGITKYIAEYKESPNKVRLFISTALHITIIMSILIGLLIIIFGNYLSRIVLIDSQYSYVFTIFGATLLLYSLNAFLMSIINGYKEFKKFVEISIVTSIVGVIFTVGLVWVWQLKGALISAVTYQSIVFFATLFFISKSPWFNYKNFNARFSKSILKKYLSYSLMTIVTAATVPVSQLFIRGYVITNLSSTDAGLWEGMNRISSMYLMVITSSFSVYYLPRLSEIKENFELRKEIFTAYKVIIPVLIFSFLGIYFFRDYIIRILFSPEFYEMRDLFIWQLIGDLFKIAAWLLAFNMLAKSMTKTFIFTEILASVLFVMFSLLFIKKNGVEGIAQAYMLSYIIYLLIMMLIFKKLIFNK